MVHMFNASHATGRTLHIEVEVRAPNRYVLLPSQTFSAFEKVPFLPSLEKLTFSKF